MEGFRLETNRETSTFQAFNDNNTQICQVKMKTDVPFSCFSFLFQSYASILNAVFVVSEAWLHYMFATNLQLILVDEFE